MTGVKEHLHITGAALKGWLIAQAYDALAVGLLWLVGLLALGVPLAPLWALLGALLQFIPIVGTVLALVGPVTAVAISGELERVLYVVIVYGMIAAIDGLLLQPYMIDRTAKVPIWASILTPLVLGLFLNVWGILLSIPLLAVIYAYREHGRRTNGTTS